MNIFKFGGASVKDAAGIENVAAILRSFDGLPTVVVVSAMGKTTNALGRILSLFRSNGPYQPELTALIDFHSSIMEALFPPGHEVFSVVDEHFKELASKLGRDGSEDEVYDQTVCYGELISTLIIHHYFSGQKLPNRWIDARNYIRTNRAFREGKVDWEETGAAIGKLKTETGNLIITQGFIGSTADGLTTTLGRDGSDFTAAIFASCLNADSVTIWKDVPGVMNADPKKLPTVTVFEELPYQEAAEMTYYGASVIHPKTIKPLAIRGIPLYVKSFDDPSLPGTKIHECHIEELPPLIVFKENQCLVSCKVTDYAFITEDHLRQVFSILTELNLRINVMQNSAMSFSFCFDLRPNKLKALLTKLKPDFEVYYNTGLTLITVKNYNKKSLDTYRELPGVLLEQYSRSTFQVLVRDGE